jgi:hypothetical protein
MRFLFATAMLLASAAVVAQPAPGTRLGTDRTAVAAALKPHGLTLVGFEREDGVIEATARGKSGRIELHIDARTGKLLAHDEANARESER